ncbi:MAG: glycosyltransferase family 2 protein [candidate division KSB1 bacterium]|nr:glycosyltransferase family 2 protein [candidate division KSB1 bacterium]MDZ7302962.1 glycosyltransferase family 2 protein [candidate division KSB1 bacterium]MDZ7312238.1 glycosyltransferase family 2 protein [candidate division KSB1 bacterium]
MLPFQTGIDDIAVVIPAYNAGETLGQVLSKIFEIIPGCQVIVVDDGSTDNTCDLATRHGTKLIRHHQNRGKGAALKTGFQAAISRPEIQAVITMDADGQHAPEHVSEFVRVFRETPVDLIIGCRQLRWPQMPIPRIASNKITSALVSWRLGMKIPDSQSGYRLHSRRLLQSIELRTNGYETESELLFKAARLGMIISFIPISTIYAGERSHIHGWRDTWRFVKLWLTSVLRLWATQVVFLMLQVMG